MIPRPPAGPVHPCPVCNSEHQTCGAGVEADPPEDFEAAPGQGPGPLRRYRVGGGWLMLTVDDAQRLGGVSDD